VVTSLPTPIPVKVGTYFDYADRLGEPWENEGVDLDEFRRMPPSSGTAMTGGCSSPTAALARPTRCTPGWSAARSW